MKYLLLILSLISLLLIIGCALPTAPPPYAGAAEVSEEKVNAEWQELDDLQQQSEELEEISFEEAEEAVRE